MIYEVIDNIYLIEKGVRSVYTSVINADGYDEISKRVKNSTLEMISFDTDEPNLKEIYIYRYPYFKNIIIGLKSAFKDNKSLDTASKKVRFITTEICLGIVLGYTDRGDRLAFFNHSMESYGLSMDDINVDSDRSLGSYEHSKKIIGEIRNLDYHTDKGWYVRDQKYIKYKAANLYKHNHAFVELVKDVMSVVCDRMEGDYGIRVLYSSIDTRTRNMFMFAFPNEIDYWIVKQLITSGYRGYAPFSKYVIAKMLGFDDEYYKDFVIK